MTGILAIILVFGGLIFFHELGHFSAARFLGMGVKTFSLGFGPVLASIKRGKTVYQLALLPFGGFVSLVGEANVEDLPEGFVPEESFSLRPAWQRFIVIASGPIFNLILAFLLCWCLLVTEGKPELLPVIGSVKEQSQAQAAGVLPGDSVVSIDGTPVERWSDIGLLIQKSQGNPVNLVITRQEQPLELTIAPTQVSHTTLFGDEVTTWVLGVSPARDTRLITYSFMSAGPAALNQAYDMVVITWKIMVGLVKGAIAADNIGGPIGIGKVIYDQSASGLAELIFLAALISVNLGVLNLLPIPVLDGGHLLFLAIEIIFRFQVPEYIREKAALTGAVLLISLMVFATFNDIMRLIG